jgi:hypothetical protein
LVLEEFEKIVRNSKLEGIIQKIPKSAQTIITTEIEIDEWLKESLNEIMSGRGKMEKIKLEESFENSKKLEHLIKITENNKFSILNFLIQKYTKILILVDSKNDVNFYSDHPVLSDIIPFTSDSNESDWIRFRGLKRGGMITTPDLVKMDEIENLSLIIKIGKIRSPIPSEIKSVNLLKSKEINQKYEKFEIENIIENNLKNFMKNSKINLKLTKISETIFQQFGTGIVNRLLSLVESGGITTERRSPLSGDPDLMPFLLYDPFMKKFKTPESAIKYIRSHLKGEGLRNLRVGRIALSEKGYVVDLSENLKMKNLIYLNKIPKLIQNEKLFNLKDRKQFKRKFRKIEN